MIFWFSGTGNSLWLAHFFATNTNELLISISEYENKKTSFNISVSSEERIGFVFPIYGWNIPKIVREFIEHIHIVNYNDNFVYFACTCGDDIGRADREMRKLLNKKGIELNCVFSLQMPNTYVCLPGFDVDAKKTQENKLKNAVQQANVFCQDVLDRKVGLSCIHPGAFPWIKTYIFGRFFYKYLMKSEQFGIYGTCIGCGRCVKFCPLENITLEKNLQGGFGSSNFFVHWGSNCTMCLSCYHHCPQHVVKYGKQTKGKGQYVHPDDEMLKEGNRKLRSKFL